MKKRKFISGCYTPVFFRIELETTSDPAAIENSDEEPTLLHEYIHFLQDVSTIQGALLLLRTFNDLKAASENILSTCCLRTVKLPVDISNHSNLAISRELDDALFGSTQALDSFPRITVLHETTAIKGPITIGQYSLGIGPNQYYKIGYIDVLESMAWGIESAIYPTASPPPDLPYNTVFRLVDYLAPQLNNPNNIYAIALCELALFTSDPMSLVVHALKDYRPRKPPKDLDDFVRHVMQGISFSSPDFGEFNNYSTAADHFLNLALSETQTIFRNSHLSEPREWAGHIFRESKRLRAKDPVFITRGLLSPDPRHYYFSLIKHSLGCPIVFNDNQIAFTFDQPAVTSGLGYFSALQELHDLVLIRKRPRCDLKGMCKRLIADNEVEYEVNEKCDHAPWLKHKDKMACMFSSLWQGYKLGKRRYSK